DLQVTLSGWARQAGWNVVWQSAYSYELVSGSRFSGSFEDSVKALLLAMRQPRPNPTAVFYGGNRVLVISNNSQTATD
ncbi:TcpQ domain-containing protein, partial [Acinetobacter baumannii]